MNSTQEQRTRYAVVPAFGYVSDNRHPIFSSHGTLEAARKAAKKHGKGVMVIESNRQRRDFEWGDTLGKIIRIVG